MDEELEDSTSITSDTNKAGLTNDENFLEIKDDHFGECTTATFLDYFSPMSKSIDEAGLSSMKKRNINNKRKYC